jgi:hypothetical protein
LHFHFVILLGYFFCVVCLFLAFEIIFLFAGQFFGTKIMWFNMFYLFILLNFLICNFLKYNNFLFGCLVLPVVLLKHNLICIFMWREGSHVTFG